MADYPELALTTDGGAAITDKNTYVTGNLSLPATADAPAFSGRMSIKLHGNSTLMFDKKPYRIKLDEKAKLLGMPKDKNWVLLANYSDKTLLRNRTALELGRRMNMAWTPRVQPVEVTLNGAYIGLYDLVEQVRVADDRVAITETEDTTAPEDAGYLMEIDERMDEAVCWRTSRNVPLCLKYPIPALTGNKPTSGPMSRRQRTVCSAPIRPML